MALSLDVQPLPLVVDRDGVVRVAGTRVTLETVIRAFLDGATAEEIAADYSVLRLSDVYAVIGYYLTEREAVAAYMKERELESDRARQESVDRGERRDLRARLLARRQPPNA